MFFSSSTTRTGGRGRLMGKSEGRNPKAEL